MLLDGVVRAVTWRARPAAAQSVEPITAPGPPPRVGTRSLGTRRRPLSPPPPAVGVIGLQESSRSISRSSVCASASVVSRGSARLAPRRRGARPVRAVRTSLRRRAVSSVVVEGVVLVQDGRRVRAAEGRSGGRCPAPRPSHGSRAGAASTASSAGARLRPRRPPRTAAAALPARVARVPPDRRREGRADELARTCGSRQRTRLGVESGARRWFSYGVSNARRATREAR